MVFVMCCAKEKTFCEKSRGRLEQIRHFGTSKVFLTYFIPPDSILLFSEVLALSSFNTKIKYKREKLGDVYVSNLTTSALRGMWLHFVCNEISVLYYR